MAMSSDDLIFALIIVLYEVGPLRFGQHYQVFQRWLPEVFTAVRWFCRVSGEKEVGMVTGKHWPIQDT
jgi:hypothetical protein